MRYGRRAAALALLVSLGLHLLLLLGLRGLPSAVPPSPEASVFEARLLAVPPPPPLRPRPAAKPLPAKAAPPEPVKSVVAPDQADAKPADVIPADAAPAEQAGAPVSAPQPLAAAVPAVASADLPEPSLNALPARIDMRFSVHYGLASGEQTLVWVSQGEHYTLTSVAAATGFAGVFYRGRFVQTSRGRITARGLQPEEFWDQRGDKRASARFDAASGQVSSTPASGEVRHFPYQAGMQDALSLFLQLALTAPPPDGTLRFAVFNGKKMRDYAFAVRGEVELDTAIGLLRSLHLVRVGNPDEGFEAWLAIDRHYLPVRVRKSDDKGNEMELRVQGLSP